MSAEQVAALADRLDAIAEELADLAIEQLKGSLRRRPPKGGADDLDDQALDVGGTLDDDGSVDVPAIDVPAIDGRAIDERRVTRARRAVEKAVGLLRAADTGPDDD